MSESEKKETMRPRPRESFGVRLRRPGAVSRVVVLLGTAAVVALVIACTRGSASDDAGAGNPARETLEKETKLDLAAYYDPPTIEADPPKTFTRSKSAPDFPNVTLIDHEGRR